MSSETMSSEEKSPWERLPGEPAKAWMAFSIYRDLGLKRSYDETSRRYHGAGKPQGGRKDGRAGRLIRGWARQYQWAERARAWDDYKDSVARDEQIQAVKEMAKRQAQEGRLLQSKGVERLKDMRSDSMGPGDAMKFVTEGAKLERLAVGAPTEELHQTSTNVNINAAETLSDADLEALVRTQLARHKAAIECRDGGNGGALSPADGAEKLP